MPLTFTAFEYDLRRCERTGRTMTFLADGLDEAAEKCTYTLNLAHAGWRVCNPCGPRRRRYLTIARKEPACDLTWVIGKEES